MSRVYDALKERLPHNWSMKRSEGTPSTLDGSASNYYQWIRWTDGETMMVEVHEAYAERAGSIERLCDQLMEQVFAGFDDPQAKYTTPAYRKWLAQHLADQRVAA